jgi:hypothetical protein
LLLLTMLLVALLTALISVNGAVAALLPVVVVMAVRLKRAPSQLLMPLVFSAHAGSLLALTGTPVNVLVYNAATEGGLPGFRYFEFALAGIPLLAGTMAIIILFGKRLLPETEDVSYPPTQACQNAGRQYGLQRSVPHASEGDITVGRTGGGAVWRTSVQVVGFRPWRQQPPRERRYSPATTSR